MSNMNPKFVAIFAFLLTGLVWSGGHLAWLILLGIFTLYAVVG